MKIIWTGLVYLTALMPAVYAQSTQTIKASKKWLALPVKDGAPKQDVTLWVDGEKVRYFDIELADGQGDWLTYVDISQWKGKNIEFRASKTYNTPLQQSNADKNALPLYKEKLRGQFHFSPKRGWTNDPNGMAYYKGEYHLFFQHNPYGTEWGNMTWGHAVSKDLLHWKEVGEAIHPDKSGTMFSGSAVVDSFNTSGLGKSPMVMFYTSAGSWGQGLAWTNDGRTFQKLPDAVVPRINKDNRDPKVIWYAPTQKWVMVVYVERDNNQHSMQFLTSPDLKTWTKTSILMGGIGNDNYMFECPEFFELPVDGDPANKKWVLTAANSQYAIGTFDGTTFKPEAERLNGQLGRDFYASQTFNNEPKGRRVEIGWWRTKTNKEGMNFNQAMSIPLELKLVTTPDGIRLTRTPVKEMESLRAAAFPVAARPVKEGDANPLANIHTSLTEIRTVITPGTAKEITFTIHGLPIVYNTEKQELLIDRVKAAVPLKDGKLDLLIYADKIGVEVFSGNGLVFMPVNVNIDTEKKSLELAVKGGEAKIESMTVYQLKSIW